MKKRSLSRNLPIYLSFLLFPMFAFAQKATVKGKVTDENNQPLPGAAVYIKGTGTGVLSSDDGSYTIQVPDLSKSILVASYTGYFSKESIATGGIMNFSLLRNAVKLKDVEVVSALGLSRQSKTIGYSQQSIDPERLTEARDVNIASALAGKVSGMQVTTTGQPTGSVRIVIRGDNSITGNNQPLWVVDGVPIDNSMGDGRNNLDYGNGAADLNPDDIANIEVLKGPNAAALYGSKAANGAILVTTKKGKSKEDGSLGVSVNQNMMWYTISEYPAYQNVYGEGNAFRTVQNTNSIIPGTNAINMGTNTRSWGAPMLGQPYNGYDGKPHGFYPQPNNIKDLYQSSFTNVTNVSVGKSDERSNFRASYTYTDGNDVLAKQNVRKKHNFNLNSSRRLGKKVNLDARLLYTLDKVKNRTFRNMDPQSPMNAYIYMLRSIDEKSLTPWRDAATGNAFSYGAQGDGYENPYWAIYENENEDIKHRIIGGTTLTVDIMEGLKFRGQISTDLTFGSGYVYREPGSRQSKLGAYSQFTQQNQNWNMEGMFMYTKRWGKEFSLNANLGTNFMQGNQLFRQQSVSSLLNHDMPSISNSNAYPVASENLVRNKTNSVYGSTTLGFRDFLFVDVTGRNDWSSTLPENNRSFFYPSVSGSFVFTQFLPEDQHIINYGKLRASWAKVGNDAGAYSLQSMFAYGGLFLGNPWLDFENLRKNPNLKPEQTTSREIGMDLSFFKDRISISASLYRSNTVDQIMRAQVARETGFTEEIVNAGEIQNSGIELSVKATPLKSKKFIWDVLVNWSKNKNLVVSLTPGVNRYTLGSWYVMTSNAEVGKPYGVLRGNAAYYSGDTMMINASTGRPYFEPNGYLGNFRPDWIGSIGNTFRYKGFDLSFLVTVKWGGDIYSVSNHKANVTGNTIQSLLGREDFYYSSLILGESGDEQNGIGLFGNAYQDKNRPKGIKYPGYNPVLNAQGAPIIGKDGRYIALKPNESWQSPQAYWQNMDNDMGNNLFDASNIRLSEVVMGYNFSSNWFRNKFIRGARVALVGRNLWTIMKHTPRGIDPEAANTTGNAQGIEQGGSFPYATYGVDLKFNF